jgi:hypothetical protein
MNTEQFETILESRLSSIKHVLGNKAKEYAIGDRLYNFKRAAEISRTTPQRALAGMFMKHLVSVLDLVEGSISPTEYMINEKIGDAINYLILLEAILKEHVVNFKCVECGECSNAEIPERQKIAAQDDVEGDLQQTHNTQIMPCECAHGELLEGLCNECADKFGSEYRLIRTA